MKGKVLFFDTEKNRGVIEDKNKNQYSFHIGEWIGEEPIIVGEEVSFEIPKEEALNIRVKKSLFCSYKKGKVMLKNTIKLSFSLSMIFLFVACGGGGSSSNSSNDESKTNQIAQKQYVIINYHYPKDVCNSSYLKEVLESYGATDIVTLSTTQSVTCETYGKSNDGVACAIQDLNYEDKPTCVAGMNRASTYNSYSKSKIMDNELFLEDIQNTIISVF